MPATDDRLSTVGAMGEIDLPSLFGKIVGDNPTQRSPPAQPCGLLHQVIG
ncbi:MAG: hypothetical protein ACE5HT_15835 [Gemmatimonadales bacterium]